jgi:glucose/mannose-6-phosphate isomerase
MVIDAEGDERMRRRFELTGERIGAAGTPVLTAVAEGPSRVARMLEGVMLGDLLSLELAAIAGVDPSSIEAIETFKSSLGRH